MVKYIVNADNDEKLKKFARDSVYGLLDNYIKRIDSKNAYKNYIR
jgi:hypothetical protein